MEWNKLGLTTFCSLPVSFDVFITESSIVLWYQFFFFFFLLFSLMKTFSIQWIFFYLIMCKSHVIVRNVSIPFHQNFMFHSTTFAAPPNRNIFTLNESFLISKSLMHIIHCYWIDNIWMNCPMFSMKRSEVNGMIEFYTNMIIAMKQENIPLIRILWLYPSFQYS